MCNLLRSSNFDAETDANHLVSISYQRNQFEMLSVTIQFGEKKNNKTEASLCHIFMALAFRCGPPAM